MAYCVHCGVKLAESEKNCPLCGTEVHDPASPWEEPETMPYPDQLEEIMQRIDRRFLRRLTLLVMLIPALTVLLIDLATAGRAAWSLYVVGALACFYVWVLAPFFYAGHRPYVYVFADFVALSLYLLLIALLTGGVPWYLGIALPTVALVTGTILLNVYFIRRVQWAPLLRAAACCLCLGAYLLLQETVIDLSLGQLRINWSVFAGIPLAVLSLVFITLEKKRNLKENIRKRLFI